MRLIDTHYYDGKLHVHGDTLSKVKELQKQDLTTEKKVLFDKLIEMISNFDIHQKYKRTAFIAIYKITADIGKPANHDKTNGIYADNVLYMICKNLKDESLGYAVEQLSDIITSGQCSQGRCTRLFQILLTLD